MSGPPEGATVRFSTPYADALRAVTDLGLQPAASVCGSDIGDYGSAAVVYRGPWWQPVGAEEAFAARDGTLVVRPTPLAAPDWSDRLRGVAGATVLTVYPANTPFNCPPRDVEGTPPPGASKVIAADQVDVAARVTFARPAVDYGAALNAVTDLGLRLADPCYERAKGRGTAPSWHPMGQEATFASAGTLVVAPTRPRRPIGKTRCGRFLASPRWRLRSRRRAADERAAVETAPPK
ncbi:MAG TPA: hypothetical protein VIC85_17825 [Ktedonobacterales bacterium]